MISARRLILDFAPNTMAPSTAPSRQHYSAHYPLVLERAGLTDDDVLAQEFETRIRAIFNAYWSAREQPTIAGIQEALKLYINGQAMVRDAMRSLAVIRSEIATAADLADLPAHDRKTRSKAI